MKKCFKCGTKLPDELNFCPMCGSQLNKGFPLIPKKYLIIGISSFVVLILMILIISAIKKSAGKVNGDKVAGKDNTVREVQDNESEKNDNDAEIKKSAGKVTGDKVAGKNNTVREVQDNDEKNDNDAEIKGAGPFRIIDEKDYSEITWGINYVEVEIDEEGNIIGKKDNRGDEVKYKKVCDGGKENIKKLWGRGEVSYWLDRCHNGGEFWPFVVHKWLDGEVSALMAIDGTEEYTIEDDKISKYERDIEMGTETGTFDWTTDDEMGEGFLQNIVYEENGSDGFNRKISFEVRYDDNERLRGFNGTCSTYYVGDYNDNEYGMFLSVKYNDQDQIEEVNLVRDGKNVFGDEDENRTMIATYSYDSEGRISEAYQKESTISPSLNADSYTSYVCFYDGDRLNEIDMDNDGVERRFHYNYDNAGNLVDITLDGSEYYYYDDNWNKTTAPLEGGTFGKVIVFSYDSNGRLAGIHTDYDSEKIFNNHYGGLDNGIIATLPDEMRLYHSFLGSRAPLLIDKDHDYKIQY